MNLASILNLTALTPPQPGAPTGAAPADNPLLAEFAALLGLTVEAASTGKDLPVAEGKALPELPHVAAELPLDLPVVLLAQPLAIPPLQLLPGDQTVPAATPDRPPTSATVPGLPLIRASIKAAAPQATPAPAPTLATPATAPVLSPAPEPAPAPLPFEARQAVSPVLITMPLPIQQQAKIPLPVQVQAQVQAVTALAQQPDPTSQQLAVAATIPPAPPRRTADVAATTAAPLLADHADLPPEAVRTAPTPVPATTPLLADPPRMASMDPIAPAISTPSPTDRHDFSAIVDKLTQARELAQPGRASLQLAHREFGPVSVQFDMAGPALKVAMTSPDAGFAPAVEAALSDRPIAALADAARSDTAGQRFDQAAPTPSATSSGPAAQNDGQRSDPNPRHSAPRHVAEQVRGQSLAARNSDDETAMRRARDGSLFA